MTFERRNSTERYDGIDGLRSCAAISIVAMHVLANGSYQLTGFIFNQLIPFFTDFVYLFMMISSFSMCCGYYEKITQCSLSPSEFYAKRYKKIWPFFAMLTFLDILISPSREALLEAFANLTLCYGLLPNGKIEVIGVGWTLGVIFVFYLLFPFFCFLLTNRKRAWLAFVVTLLMRFACDLYFFDEYHVMADFSRRGNILYSAAFFMAGGLIYLYRNAIAEKVTRNLRWLLLLGGITGALWSMMIESNGAILVLTFSFILMYVVCRGSQKGLLNNVAMKYVSGVSMEIYLCHMVVYRVVEKLGWHHLFSSHLFSYCATFVFVLSGSILFAVAAKWGINKVTQLLENRRFRKLNEVF